MVQPRHVLNLVGEILLKFWFSNKHIWKQAKATWRDIIFRNDVTIACPLPCSMRRWSSCNVSETHMLSINYHNSQCKLRFSCVFIDIHKRLKTNPDFCSVEEHMTLELTNQRAWNRSFKTICIASGLSYANRWCHVNYKRDMAVWSKQLWNIIRGYKRLHMLHKTEVTLQHRTSNYGWRPNQHDELRTSDMMCSKNAEIRSFVSTRKGKAWHKYVSYCSKVYPVSRNK